MQTSISCPQFPAVACDSPSQTVLFCLLASVSHAASIRGVVTDATGAKVTGASISLISNGTVVASSVSSSDGSFQLTTGSAGRFFLVVTAKSFRQLQTPDFYAGQLDSIERNLVLEPAWVRESIVVTATGVPTPQPQTSEATTVLSMVDLALRTDFVSALRMMPGVKSYKRANSARKLRFLSAAAIPRTTRSCLTESMPATWAASLISARFPPRRSRARRFIADPIRAFTARARDSSVVNLTTPHGTTSFPSLLFEGDAGNLFTSREQLEVAGAHKKLDYLGAFSWLQSANDLPNDEYHVATTAANLGWALNSNTQIRATLHDGVASTGVPNAWDFHHVADDATEKSQDIFLSASIENQTTASFRNAIRYGLTRKREQDSLWTQSGNQVPASVRHRLLLRPGDAGQHRHHHRRQRLLRHGTGRPRLQHVPCAIRQQSRSGGLPGRHHNNAASVRPRRLPIRGRAWRGTGQQLLHARRAHQLRSSRGARRLQAALLLYARRQPGALLPLRFTGFAARRLELLPAPPAQRRFQRHTHSIQLRQGDPRTQAYRSGRFALQLPRQNNGAQSTIQALHIGPLAAPTMRTYEGGLEQAFLSQHIIFKTSYFHNEFGKEIEYVGLDLIPELLPNLTPTQQAAARRASCSRTLRMS